MLSLHTLILTVVSKSDLGIEEKSFSIQWRIWFQKLIAWKASIGNYQWLSVVFVCSLLNTAKYVVYSYYCWKPSLGVFYIGGVLRGLDGFGKNAPAVGSLLKQSFEKKIRCGCFLFVTFVVFFVDLQDFWEHLPCKAQTTVSVYFRDHYYH